MLLFPDKMHLVLNEKSKKKRFTIAGVLLNRLDLSQIKFGCIFLISCNGIGNYGKNKSTMRCASLSTH